MVKIVRQNYRCNHIIFNKIKNELKKIIHVDYIINHVGSTAIPNMSGKNIIDILIGVLNQDDLMATCHDLTSNGYYLGREKRKKYQFLASRKEETLPGDIHIHVAVINTKIYNDFLLLKNYLLNNSFVANNYSNYKLELAKKLNRKDYRRIKSNYVNNLIIDARKYYLNNYPSKIILLRHGKNIIDSKLNNNQLPLSDKGKMEAYKIKNKLNNNFDIIISSPSLRTKETAKIVGNNHDYIIDNRLLEKGYGNKKQDGKETTIDSYNRLISFLDDLKKYKNKRVLIVTHGSLLNLARNIIEERNIKRNHIGNCYMIEYINNKE